MSRIHVSVVSDINAFCVDSLKKRTCFKDSPAYGGLPLPTLKNPFVKFFLTGVVCFPIIIVSYIAAIKRLTAAKKTQQLKWFEKIPGILRKGKKK